MSWASYVGEIIASGILHVVFIGIFILYFFFNIASKIEATVVVNQTNLIVNTLMHRVLAVLPTGKQQAVADQLKNLEMPDLTGTDAPVQQANCELLQQALRAFIVLTTVGCCLVLFIWWLVRFPMFQVLWDNLLLVGVVALVEYSFLAYLASRYQPSSVEFATTVVIQAVETWSNAASQ